MYCGYPIKCATTRSSRRFLQTFPQRCHPTQTVLLGCATTSPHPNSPAGVCHHLTPTKQKSLGPQTRTRRDTLEDKTCAPSLPRKCHPCGVSARPERPPHLANAAPVGCAATLSTHEEWPEKDSTSDAFSTSYMLTCMSSHAVSSKRESAAHVQGA
eukprot:357000-Chlamydomonas_euryale.AAC.1